MAIERKEKASPAFRYFIFILCVCIFLFAFLMTRLMTGVDSRMYNDYSEKPSFRVEAAPPILEKAFEPTPSAQSMPEHFSRM